MSRTPVDAALLLRLEHAVDDLLAREPDPVMAMPGILAAIGTALGWPLASVWTWTGGGLRQAASWHLEGAPGSDHYRDFATWSRQFTFGPGEGLPGKVWVAGRALWIHDVDDAEQFPRAPFAQTIGLRSALAFPVVGDTTGRLDGVIELFIDRLLDPDPTLLATLASLGHRLGSHMSRAREELRARSGEALLRATVDSALDAVVVAGADGRILEFNPAATAMFGWTQAEAVGRDFADLIIPAHLRDRHRAAWRNHLETGQTSILGTRVELAGLRRDGMELPVELTITEAVVDGRPTFAGHIRDLTERRRAERDLMASRRRVVSAGDEARRRLERNLHDGVQQRLVSLALLLGRARSALPADPDHAAALLDTAVAELSESADELRRLARGIHPAGLSRHGLGAALADLARRSGPLVTVGALPQGRYDETVEVTAFYVAAESVTNALRHAPGATVEIGAVDHGDMLVVRVADDGPGGALIANRYLEEGSGLAGLRDRVSAVGGSLTVKSAPQRGTTVVARLPLSASAEA